MPWETEFPNVKAQMRPKEFGSWVADGRECFIEEGYLELSSHTSALPLPGPGPLLHTPLPWQAGQESLLCLPRLAPTAFSTHQWPPGAVSSNLFFPPPLLLVQEPIHIDAPWCSRNWERNIWGLPPPSCICGNPQACFFDVWPLLSYVASDASWEARGSAEGTKSGSLVAVGHSVHFSELPMLHLPNGRNNGSPLTVQGALQEKMCLKCSVEYQLTIWGE